jgi:peptidoglycan/xylan/chitin deacetylase (PgdA/CDA1 family)
MVAVRQRTDRLTHQALGMIHEILIGEHQGLEPILTHQREKPFGSDFRRLDLRFWRLHRIFKERDLPMTVYACALALERNPPAAHAIKEVGYDICCHGWCWIEHFRLDEATEREHIRMAVESLKRTVGQRPELCGKLGDGVRRAA